MKTTYFYNELNEAAQERAREQFQDGRDYEIETEIIKENFERELEERGLPSDDVRFSLGYCKGDGVAFYGIVPLTADLMERAGVDVKSRNLLLEAIQRNWTLEVDITRNSLGHRYAHWNTMVVTVVGDWVGCIAEDLLKKTFDITEDDEDYEIAVSDWTEKVENAWDEAENLIADYVKDTSHELEAQGYEQYDYCDSDEYIEDTLVANDYEYTEEGELL